VGEGAHQSEGRFLCRLVPRLTQSRAGSNK
jgi:hypothetical protein